MSNPAMNHEPEPVPSLLQPYNLKCILTICRESSNFLVSLSPVFYPHFLCCVFTFYFVSSHYIYPRIIFYPHITSCILTFYFVSSHILYPHIFCTLTFSFVSRHYALCTLILIVYPRITCILYPHILFVPSHSCWILALFFIQTFFFVLALFCILALFCFLTIRLVSSISLLCHSIILYPHILFCILPLYCILAFCFVSLHSIL